MTTKKTTAKKVTKKAVKSNVELVQDFMDKNNLKIDTDYIFHGNKVVLTIALSLLKLLGVKISTYVYIKENV